MRTRFIASLCAVILTLGMYSSTFAAQVSPSALTGVHWKQSSESEKLAFLYGASNIIAIEELTAQHQGKEPSPFVSAWIKAFGDISWKQIQEKIDSWYAEHPSEEARPVLNVLWYEFMAPAAQKQ